MAPDADIPMTSWAPKLAEMKARLEIQRGMEWPLEKKSELLFTRRFKMLPIPTTKAK